MANQVKNYFLAPSLDYSPGGLLALGTIITSPKRAVPPLARAPDLPPPQVSSSKYDFTWTKDHASSTNLGVWAKFLQLIDAGISTEWSQKTQEVYSFKRMETTELFPEPELIRQALSAPSVKQYLERHHLRKSLYMIVGIKSVSGATVKTVHGSGRGGKVNAEIDLSLVGGPPVAPGTSVEGHTEGEEKVEFIDNGEFVFAFRVRKVRITRKGDVHEDEYNRHALLGLGGNDDDADASGDALVIEGLEEFDASGEEFALGEQAVHEASEQVHVSVYSER